MWAANRNAQDGLSLQSLGSVLLNNIQAAFNDTNRGDSSISLASPLITVNLPIFLISPSAVRNYLANNTEFGLIAQTDGLVQHRRPDAGYQRQSNQRSGMYLDAQGVGKPCCSPM